MSLITTPTKKDMNEVNTERSCQELGLQLRFAAEKGSQKTAFGWSTDYKRHCKHIIIGYLPLLYQLIKLIA